MNTRKTIQNVATAAGLAWAALGGSPAVPSGQAAILPIDDFPVPGPIAFIVRPDNTATGIAISTTATTNPCVVADDFIAPDSEITDVHIWGSWLNEKMDPDATFIISLWADEPATGGAPSHPAPFFGGPVWSGFFGPNPNAVRAAAYAGAYSVSPAVPAATASFFEPTRARIIGNASKAYCYHFTIPIAMQPLVTPGAVYWVSVTTVSTGSFGWRSGERSGSASGRAAFNTVSMPSTTPWQQLRYPAGHPLAPNYLEMAFAATSRRVNDYVTSLTAVEVVWPRQLRPYSFPETILLTGTADVLVDVGPQGQTATTDLGGRDAARAEMVSMDLSGLSSLGPVRLKVRRPDQSPVQRSMGWIAESMNQVSGRLDLPEFGGTAGGASAFGLFAELQILNAGYGNPIFHNELPEQLQGMVTDVTPGMPLPGRANTLSARFPTDWFNEAETQRARVIRFTQVPNPPVDGTPVILFPPESQSAIPGSTVRLGVTAAAPADFGTFTPLSYQWQRKRRSDFGFTNIPAATNATYVTPLITAADDGTIYQVRVTGRPGYTTVSDPATLTVSEPWLSILRLPDDSLSLVPSDPRCVLQASDRPGGPYLNIGVGSPFSVPPGDSHQFFRASVMPTQSMGTVVGRLTDPSGRPLKGLTVGLPNGGLNATTDADGNFALEGVPAGPTRLRITSDIVFIDPLTDFPLIFEIDITIEITVKANGTVVIEVKVVLFVPPPPPPDPCNCTPWCAIGFGTADGKNTPLYFGGGANGPRKKPGDKEAPKANCGDVEVSVTNPAGMTFPIVAGTGLHQNSGAPAASGTWTVTTTVCGKTIRCPIDVP